MARSRIKPDWHGSDSTETETKSESTSRTSNGPGHPIYDLFTYYDDKRSKMSNFNPTHKFRGLELEYLDKRGSAPAGRFLDSDGSLYHIPFHRVTVIPPRPKPGEVWKYIGTLARGKAAGYRLEVVNRSGYFRDLDGDVTLYEGNESSYKKVLNADGTPA